MKPERKLKIQNILIIVLISIIFGLVYNYLFYPHTLTEFLEAASIGAVLGIAIGILEEFVLAKSFRSKSFQAVTAIRVSLYSIIISLTLAMVLSIEVSINQDLSYWEAFRLYLTKPTFRRDFIFSFLFIMFMLFSLEVILLVGRRNFFRLLLGRYHQPREVERIFMFVDLKDSTSIAERLSHKSYSAFIRDFFRDISEAIILHQGEIYQYVGDEVVIVWPFKSSNSHYLDCFYKMQQIIRHNETHYQSRYGLLPRFKAGVHGGMVIVTAIGKQKKEIAYHGDVLNSAARIQGKCNELKEELLVSDDVFRQTVLSSALSAKENGEIELRGKVQRLKLHGIRQIENV